MRIAARDLTEFDIEEDGRSVTLHVVDEKGSPIELNLLVDQLGRLAMTLPNIIDAAIRRQYRDTSFSSPIRWNPG
jgi:hypothetical protein